MERRETISRLPNPRKGASILSIMTFAYTIPVFLKGFKKEFQEEDIMETLDVHASKKLGDLLEESWEREKLLHPKNPSLWRAHFKVFGLQFLILGSVLVFTELVCKISQPLALSQLIKYYTQNDDKITLHEAYMYASLIVGASLVLVLTGHTYVQALQHFGMKLRIANCSLIYRKSLKLSKAVLGGTTIGQLTNLLSNDVNRFDSSVIHAHNIWLCPVETLIILFILYNLLGLTTATGILFLAAFIPLQMYLGKKTSVLRLKTALRTDERVRLMNEIISGIQVIKMYTWEKPFSKLVETARRLEIKQIRATSYIRGLIISFSTFTTKFAIFLTILTYVLLEDAPTAEYVFVVTSFYNMLRQAMTVHFPKGITELAEVRVSVSRLQKFLLYEEIDIKKDIQILSPDSLLNSKEKSNGFVKESKIHVELKNASAKWLPSSTDDTLHKINFRVTESELVGVIGQVGSGKTSLLHVILKELPVNHGTVSVEGKISYASQEPWIFAGTIQQNILFGQPMNMERYQEVVRVCALERDLILLPYGDKSLVGERGVSLSGGQKARVSLARAIYREADIYLLDDPLSAVDTHVGKQLFEECILKFLKNKCTILITHQLQYMRNVQRIYLIEDGTITASGSYQKIRESGLEFAKQLTENKDDDGSGDVELIKILLKEDTARAIEVKEQRSSGNISKSVYLSYLKAGGSMISSSFIFIMFITTQLSVSAADYFITYWVNLEQRKLNINGTDTNDSTELSRETCIYIYSGIATCMVILSLTRSFSFFRYCMKASTKLHNSMFSNIVYTSMRFFNTNSSGRILNRFSKDMGSIDEVIPSVALDCMHIGLVVVGVTVVVSTVNPWLLIVTVVILTVFYLLRIVYLSTSRGIKRLEGITRSPVFAHMNASLQGLTTIRAFGAQKILQTEFDNHQDLHSSVWYLFLACSRAFGFYLDVICVGYIASVTFSFFIGDNEQFGGNVGLAITQALSLTGMFQWGMRQWSELENQMTAVERVVEYTKLEHEPERIEKTPAKTWPENGDIRFESVSLRYSLSDHYVLKGLSFRIKSKEKIGIVGRTGAGKSSLINALFQLTITEGSIVIDNIDVTKISLHALRSKISIIPQEPVLFSGPLRKNLDPFDEYPDDELWKALAEVELKNVVSDFPGGLNYKMSEGGSNFSVGQRQLVCLARAVIRKNKILVLDEATANVDPQTDALIQNTIRQKFAECTVLTIAHRLNTIMDSDKVLVVDSGKIAEFDHPYLLLKEGKGTFYDMVQQTGHAMVERLSRIAENSYKQKVRDAHKQEN